MHLWQSVPRHAKKAFVSCAWNIRHQFGRSVRSTRQVRMSENTENTENTENFANFEAKLSLETPLQDYIKLMEEKMKSDAIVSDEVLDECFLKIAAAARKTVWRLLFKEQPLTAELQKKAGDLLAEHKGDACFYSPWEYNRWIVKVRDELLKRNMLDFWRDYIVKNELGLCWARDSDLFDDLEAKEPVEFYNHGGCEAPWLKEEENEAGEEESDDSDSDEEEKGPPAKAELKKISSETPLQDYTYNMEAQSKADPDDEESYKKIFDEAHQVIWSLLFAEDTLSKENSTKAAELLKAVKRDACYYSPYVYNEWIVKVRDELFAREYFDFWRSVIVEQKLGLCWYKDSDYFDDEEDTKPLEFYKSGDALMEAHKK